MNQLKSTFVSNINVKMIMIKTNDFFLHDLRALASLISVQNHRPGSVNLRHLQTDSVFDKFQGVIFIFLYATVY